MSCYHHLTMEERESLMIYSAQGKGIRAMAQRLGRAPSTISRELRRNRAAEYLASKAQAMYQKRRRNCVRHARLEDNALALQVQFLLGRLYWSPEEISHRLALDGGGKLSTSTIYRGLENGLLRDTLRANLRIKYHRLGKNPRPKSSYAGREIDRRPKPAAERSELGHWEGDTVNTKGAFAAVVTLVDRKSRFLLAESVKRKQAKSVCDAVINLLSSLPEPVRSITFDRGTEFSLASEMENALHTQIFFCHPHAPWERPSNENTNGLLRQFIPKFTQRVPFSPQALPSFTALLNFRPRKCLFWRTPYEVFWNTVLHFT